MTASERMKLFGWASPHPETQLFAPTVWEDIAFGPSNLGLTGTALSERVREAMEFVGLSDKLKDRHPYSLSGGQRRRAALAGVLAMRNRYYILDEPTAGLDEQGRDGFISIIRKLSSKGCGILWITHELELLDAVVNDLWLMENGALKLKQDAEEYVRHYAD